jgi:hypothetical protein
MAMPVADNMLFADRGVTQAQLAGRFVYRFSGPVMKGMHLYELMGIGQFQLDQQGKLAGSHKYSIMRLVDSDSHVMTGTYRLSGQLSIESDGTGSATIEFRSTEGPGGHVDGKFHVLVADTVDRFWMIASGGPLPDDRSREMASFEAIRVKP